MLFLIRKQNIKQIILHKQILIYYILTQFDQKMSSRVYNQKIAPNQQNNLNNDHLLQINQNITNSLNHSLNPIDIVFRNIVYQVQIKQKSNANNEVSNQKVTKTILNNLTGICKGGEVTALMGASGAGKTTLLNVLSCRVTPTSGELLANNHSYDYQTFGNFANYVMQKDVLMETLTVRETLMFVANLKLTISHSQKLQRIEEVSKSMKLQKCMDVLVGGPLIKGISGGEKKRTSIAFQLISDPHVIVLDEPTSGLDSLTSFIIIDYLSQLAHQKGKTVLMTIHQPNSQIFAKFDRLLLLSEGNLVYQGNSNLGIDYFATKLNRRIPQFMNPAQFFIDQMHQEKKQNAQALPVYKKSYQLNLLPSVSTEISSSKGGDLVKRSCDISFTTSFGELLKRDVINTMRNPMLFKSRVFQSIFLAIYTGGLYFNAGRKDYTDQINWAAIVGYFFFLAISSMMSSLSPVTLVFPAERQVFLKEESARMYSVVPYFMSRNIIEIPYMVLLPLLFNVIIYWMVGQSSTPQQFFLFFFISFLVNFAGSSLGLFIGCVVTDEKSVAAVTPVMILPIFVFSGVFKNTANLPDWIGWLQYLSPLKYGFLSMVVNETNEKASLVSQLNFNLSMWSSIFILIGLSIGLRCIALLFLWLLKTKLQ